MKSENLIAKNLLLENICQTCNHYKVQGLYDPYEGKESCASLLRARRVFKIRNISSLSWFKFKQYGNKIPKEKTCEYWE